MSSVIKAQNALEGNFKASPVKFSNNEYIQNKIVSMNAISQYSRKYSALREIWLNARENDRRTFKETGSYPKKIEITFPSFLMSGVKTDNIDGSIIRNMGDVDNSINYGEQEWCAFEADYSSEKREIVVRNYGLSMTHEEFATLIGNAGETTKFDSEEYGGGFGIGSLSPLSVSDSVTFENIHDGVKSKIIFLKDRENGISFIGTDEIPFEETDQEDGMIVKFYVRSSDLNSMSDDFMKMFLFAGPSERVKIFTDPTVINVMNDYVQNFSYIDNELHYGWNLAVTKDRFEFANDSYYLIDGCRYLATNSNSTTDAIGTYNVYDLSAAENKNLVSVPDIHLVFVYNDTPSRINDRDSVLKPSVSRETLINSDLPEYRDSELFNEVMKLNDILEYSFPCSKDLATDLHKAYKTVTKELKKNSLYKKFVNLGLVPKDPVTFGRLQFSTGEFIHGDRMVITIQNKNGDNFDINLDADTNYGNYFDYGIHRPKFVVKRNSHDDSLNITRVENNIHLWSDLQERNLGNFSEEEIEFLNTALELANKNNLSFLNKWNIKISSSVTKKIDNLFKFVPSLEVNEKDLESISRRVKSTHTRNFKKSKAMGNVKIPSRFTRLDKMFEFEGIEKDELNADTLIDLRKLSYVDNATELFDIMDSIALSGEIPMESMSILLNAPFYEHSGVLDVICDIYPYTIFCKTTLKNRWNTGRAPFNENKVISIAKNRGYENVYGFSSDTVNDQDLAEYVYENGDNVDKMNAVKMLLQVLSYHFEGNANLEGYPETVEALNSFSDTLAEKRIESLQEEALKDLEKYKETMKSNLRRNVDNAMKDNTISKESVAKIAEYVEQTIKKVDSWTI